MITGLQELFSHRHRRRSSRDQHATSYSRSLDEPLVFLAPTSPLALTPLVGTAGLSTSILCAASLSTGVLGLAGDRDAGTAVSACRSRGASLGGVGAVLSSAFSGSTPGGRARGSRARAVQLALDESEGVLAVHVAIALVRGFVTSVTAVRVGAVAVRLHLGAGLLCRLLSARFDILTLFMLF